MKILYICHRFPYPPKRGGKIRPFNMIKHLSQQGHQVWVASLARSQQEYNECSGIKDYCHQYTIGLVSDAVQWIRMIINLLTPTPSSLAFFFSSTLKKQINIWLAEEEFDLIFVHCSSVAQYVENVKHIPKILDYGDMDSEKWLTYRSFKPFPFNWGYWLEGTKMKFSEKSLARKFDLTTCTTRAELDTLESYGTAIKTDWFPNGVDADFFQPDGTAYDPHSISFIGRMDYFPNQQCMLQFCHHTLPLIQEKIPDTKLYIVGAEPSKKIKALEKINGVVVTGSVKDVRPYILKTAAMVAPLNIARGTQNKILEAMAMGVPVVSSTLAAGGIDAIAGEHFLTADTPAEYAEKLINLMESAPLREKYAKAGRERMLSNHAWQRSMKKMESLILNCVSRNSEKTHN
ncbi:TIGR03087 family PEP-CTERM/XrtA system glycosyltransferase [Nitrosomonas sp.]|uniref:TIGR03087 family PEP-CTERM/XrtA system glycosyltransferase n=1 Tax=Nitrosomonas sp. TaxID=42353 RepID=UPI00284F17B5|nr:TIGR03087 family PEP-CTERM/XrtA system glycosyltransferase [Nitrosomonas sp.]MDR4515066.1 TIGR03087 family PEP-CTERM/XrtA system glycosyltransferase [Nitrosomonas sp.]